LPRCFSSLALAASSHPYSAEDRLTELYAVALEAHSGFASKVFALADLPPAEIYEVFTQELLEDGSGRLDLRVRAIDANGEPLSILYAEHKQPGGDWADGQPQKYLPDLRRETRRTRAQGRFLVVVGSGDDVKERIPRRARSSVGRGAAEATEEAELLTRRRGPLVIAKTWQDIARCAERAGREALIGENPLGWRDAAAQSDAAASQRVLRELLWYLEEKGYAVTNGLTPQQLAMATQALEIEDAIGALLDATTPHLVRGKIGRFQLKVPRGGGRDGRAQHFTMPAGSWVEKWRGGIWFGYGTNAPPGRRESDGQLEFEVGVWLLKKQAKLLDANKLFRTQLKADSFTFEVDDDGGAIWASEEAKTFIKTDAAEAMDAQAARIAAWALPRLEVLLTLKPGRYNG
jgi:hypothetical protein